MIKSYPLLPAFLWAVIIFILCAIPGKDLPDWSWVDLFDIDKVIHAFIFSMLVFLMLKGSTIRKRETYQIKKSYVAALLIAIPYGVLLELMQEYFYTDRQGSWPDFIANTIGAFAGIWLFKKYGMHKWTKAFFEL